ncbi:MAG: ribonuclease [Patescibacteria group bacterium]|nr:ribonuclease [Patescibacteria group bacterium]
MIMREMLDFQSGHGYVQNKNDKLLTKNHLRVVFCYTIKMNTTIVVFTDGSSRGNPGKGGYGAVIVMPGSGKVVERGGREDHTTNNRMEMTSAHDVLMYLKNENNPIEIHTDSSYLINGITKWVYGWEKNGWKTSTKTDVENKDLWKLLAQDVRAIKSKLVWKKIKGHAGITGNERADEIATLYADGKKVALFTGALSIYEQMLGKNILSFSPEKTSMKKKSSSSTKPAYSYVSMVGSTVNTDKSWAECEKRVKGKKGARFKKVFSKEEEQNLIQEWTLKNLLG